MKYDEVQYLKEETQTIVKVKDYLPKQLEDMEKEGEFLCPFEGCKAKLCLVHNSKNGGRTFFFKAVDDEQHMEKCDYKIENYKEVSIKVNANGIFTEGQVNASVRSLYNDYTRPLQPNGEENKKKKDNKTKEKRKSGTQENGANVRRTSSTGRIVYGEENVEDVKGRMRRRFHITNDDIGQMTKVCGIISEINRNQHGEMFFKFKEERLNNIQVFIGPVYKHNNSSEYERLHLVKEYFDKVNKTKDVMLAAGGLVNEHNSKLVLELQANGSFIVDGKTIMRMIIEKTKESL